MHNPSAIPVPKAASLLPSLTHSARRVSIHLDQVNFPPIATQTGHDCIDISISDQAARVIARKKLTLPHAPHDLLSPSMLAPHLGQLLWKFTRTVVDCMLCEESEMVIV